MDSIAQNNWKWRRSGKRSRESQEILSDALFHINNDFEELREAATRLALVGAITHFQHWIAQLAEKVPKKPKVKGATVIKQMKDLNSRLGDGPVAISEFQDLVDVRDSIIHADSDARWEFSASERKIADRFRGPRGKVQFSEDDLVNAVELVTKQVIWYDSELRRIESSLIL